MAFGITVESPMPRAERISRSLGVYAGKVSITSYATTLVECTGITRYFKPTSNATTGGYKDGVISCQIDGPSSGGYVVRWDHTTGGFRCFSPTGSGLPVTSAVGGASLNYTSGGAKLVTATSAVGTLIGAVATEAAANITVGTFSFVAVGLV